MLPTGAAMPRHGNSLDDSMTDPTIGRRIRRRVPRGSGVVALGLLALALATACATTEEGGSASANPVADRSVSVADARQALEAGLDDASADRPEAARARFARASQAPSGALRGRALYMLGLTELEMKRPAAARAALLEAARENDVIGDYALYHAGRAAMEAGDPAGAAKIFSDLRLRYGDSRWRPAAALGAGRAYLALGNGGGGRDAITRAIQEGLPSDRVPGARLALGEAQERVQDTQGALRIYKDLWLTRPETPEADEAGGRIARIRGQGPDAFSTAAEREGRADLLFRRFAYEKALLEYQALAARARREDDRGRAYEMSLQAAHCTFRLRRYPDALAAFRGLRSAYPGRRGIEEADYYAARSLARSQRYDEAFAAFRRLIASHGGTRWGREARFRLATLLEDRGRLDEAVVAYEAVLRGGLAEHRLESLWRLGWIDHKRGRDAAALARLDRLAASSGEALSRQAAYWAARIREATGDRSGAAAGYRVIARGAPLSYYRFAAEARLEALGERPGGGPAALGPDPPLPAAPPDAGLGAHYQRGLELVAIRQSEDAGAEMALVPRRGGMGLSSARLFLVAGAYYEASRMVADQGSAGSGETLRFTYPRAYPHVVRAEAARNGIDPRLVWAVMREESTFRPAIRSPAGAVGLLQIMPATARRVGSERGIPDADARLSDPAVNLRLGAFYLGKLQARYGGIAPRAIAGYNAGEEAVDRWLGDMPPAILAEADAFVEEIPFQETRDYVKKVWRSYSVYRRLYPDDGGAAIR